MATIIITGANRGIGLELTRQLAARGDDVIAVCRKSSPELDAVGVRVESGIDVAKGDDVAELRRRLEGTQIDVLMNNAGILRRGGLDEVGNGDVLDQFVVNSLGPLRVTAALLGNLHEGSKVGIVTSRMGSIEDNDSGGAYGYRMSKAVSNGAPRGRVRALLGVMYSKSLGIWSANDGQRRPVTASDIPSCRYPSGTPRGNHHGNETDPHGGRKGRAWQGSSLDLGQRGPGVRRVHLSERRA